MAEPVARTVKDFCLAYGIGLTKTYELMATGALVAVKAGKRTLIREDSAKAWLANLCPTHKSTHEKTAVVSERQRRTAKDRKYKGPGKEKEDQ